MGIGLLSVLQMVPWSDVIKNAPKVADGAKQLWKSVGKKPAIGDATATEQGRPVLSPEAQAIAILQTHQSAAEAAIGKLHEQMLESSKLITALAEQNTFLIEHVKRNRTHLMWLTGATVVFGIVAVAGLCSALWR